MPVSKANKQAKHGASKGKAAASKKTARPSKPEGKKEGTRVSTMVDVRGVGSKKGGGGGSRDKLRDGN
jgi:hypothetical protein